MRYRNKLELYGSSLVENELGELSKDFGKIKDVYCEIIPSHGGVKSIGGTEVEESFTMQRIFIRKKSIKEPKIDMYFKDSLGCKYEVLDFFPNYKNNAEWEFRTRINYE
ncbi:hypothetical protein [Tissierella creatinophila]|uniref:Phage head-tail joining protein n=1 Tax=Tissierella creatinophila DSM 6911 TaxID=1123403 RepID=A0A1U7M529_TISCR|nr:hypothetical protein [Tissierella creatinophila]OLS02422.1 hypothetical protein TICRE_16110 [Tissierella creatinophila DSM 6911]